MKNILTIFFAVVLLSSCGSTKNVDTMSKKEMKGSWELSSISYSETGKFNVNMLNDVSAQCFTNSVWNFIPNNNTGSYAINGAECVTGDRNFVFTVEEPDGDAGLYYFLLKPTNEDHKSGTNHGFRMRLAELTETTMMWQQTVSVEGEPFTINMNFNKI